ncbi:MAG: demethoxyubiquinone hydroxylase family protein [Oceanicaulis sp.]
MVRVDHAGEYGAVRIYRGQRAIFAGQPAKARIAGQLQRMEADEQHHLDAFDDHIRSGLARPTLLGPVWDAAGVALGAVTALMGERAAHACTEAVESVIEGHYGRQVEELRLMGETALADQFAQFQAEEVEHKDLAVTEGAKDAFGYPLLSAAITAGCHAAIAVTSRV